MTESQTVAKRAMRAYGWAGVSTREQARSEKESIPAQKREIEAAARHLGVTLLETLVVPGFSRNYIDFHEMRDDMAREGITAPARLQALWEQKALDVFICKDADRFGRTISVFSYIAAHLVFVGGARIYVASKGIFIDPDNFNMFVSMFGLMAADEVKRLRERYDMGMKGRFARGLPGARIPFTHQLVGDRENRRLIVNPDRLPFMHDLAELLLAGVPYEDLPKALAARGHINPETGQEYSHMFVHRLLYNPYTWGHVARRYARKRGVWAYDETAAPPPDVEVMRDAVPPVYTGELALALQAELRRRKSIITGRASPVETHRYSGLMRCAVCGHGLVYNSNGYYFCCQPRLKTTRRGDAGPCPNRKFIRESTADEQIGAYLRRWIEQPSFDLSLPEEDVHGPHERLAILEGELTQVEGRLRQLIHLQSTAPLATAEFYQDEIATLADRLTFLRVEIARAKALRPSAARRYDRQTSRDELGAMGVKAFFEQADVKINQALHRILGLARFKVEQGEIVGVHFPDF